MKKIIYFDCYMGISGDMVLGACLDLGVDRDQLEEELKKLHVDGYRLSVQQLVKNGFTGTDVTVVSTRDGAPVDAPHHVHDLDHSHAHTDDHEHAHMHDHEHTHDHEHVHTDDADAHMHSHEHGHGHVHRTLHEIRDIIRSSDLDQAVKDTAISIFQVIAEAEAKVHGRPVEEVGFHEVGALDSIVDICGAAICLHLLGVDEVHCSVVREGTGFIMCQHGQLPVPVPAVMNMMPGSGITIKQTDEVHTELVTPTGFGILKGTHAVCGPIPEMEVEAVGLGFGKRETGRLNGLRAILGHLRTVDDLPRVDYDEDEAEHAHTHSHNHGQGAHTYGHEHGDGAHTHGHEHGDGAHMHGHEQSQGAHVHSHSHGGHTHTHSADHTIRLRNRLAKAIGHLERVKQMVEDERDCCDVLMQLAAVRSALTNTGKYILKEHMSSCLIEAVENKEFSEIEELNRAIEYFIK